MAYVPGFEWDIFISYPYESDQPDAYDLEWVSEFHRVLKKEIEDRVADKNGPKIFFDRRHFRASDHLEGDLLDAVRKSALFLAVVSPRYVADGKFTLRELATFCERQDVARRIVNIELLPVEDERPEALRGPKRNRFYVIEDERAIKLISKSDEYAKRLQMVAEDIKDVLHDLRRKAGKIVETGSKPFAGKTVLLAEKEEDVAAEWEDVRVWLQDFGARVLPDPTKHSNGRAEFIEQFKADLGQADLFIQLLSPIDELIHWSEQPDVPSPARLQREVVESGSSIPGLQWRKSIKIKREMLKHWDVELLEGPHVIASGLEEFKREVKKALSSLIAPAPVRRKSTTPYIYITADDADLTHAFALKETAESKLKCSCAIIAAKNRMKNFRETLEIADIVVFLFGGGTPEFMDEWLNTYAKLKATGKTKPPQVEALYRAPPPKTETRQKLRGALGGEFLQIGSEDAFSAEDIQRLLRELPRWNGERPSVDIS